MRHLLLALLVLIPPGCDESPEGHVTTGTPDVVKDLANRARDKARDKVWDREERIDAAYARCLVRFGTGTCRLIEQRGLSRCYRPDLGADFVKKCVGELLERNYMEDTGRNVVAWEPHPAEMESPPAEVETQP